jgi:hypothetical protein
MTRRFPFLFFGCLLVGVALAAAPARVAHAATAAPVSLIPLPAQLSVGVGSFSVDAHTPIVIADHAASTRQTATYLAELIARTRGLHLPVPQGAATAHAIVLRLDPHAPVATVKVMRWMSRPLASASARAMTPACSTVRSRCGNCLRRTRNTVRCSYRSCMSAISRASSGAG